VTSLKHFRTLLDPRLKRKVGPTNRKQDCYKSSREAGPGEVNPFNMGMECFPTALYMCGALLEPRFTSSLRGLYKRLNTWLQFPYEIKFSSDNHCLLGCDAVQFSSNTTFWRTVLSPSSGSRDERSKKQLQLYLSLAS
jgi:hypothetical protein